TDWERWAEGIELSIVRDKVEAPGPRPPAKLGAVTRWWWLLLGFSFLGVVLWVMKQSDSAPQAGPPPTLDLPPALNGGLILLSVGGVAAGACAVLAILVTRSRRRSFEGRIIVFDKVSADLHSGDVFVSYSSLDAKKVDYIAEII